MPGETVAGGSGGGGAVLTELGKPVVNTYRAIEVDSALAARKHLPGLAPVNRCADRGREIGSLGVPALAEQQPDSGEQ